MDLTNGEIVMWEALGTGILMLVGTSAVANTTLKNSGGRGTGWLMCAISWGFAVFAGASIADPTGGHLNPAVTLAQIMRDVITVEQGVFYVIGQMIGAFCGAVLTYLAFKKQFDTHDDMSQTRGVFCTAPMVRSYGWNTLTEVIATFVLILFILLNPSTNAALGYAAVAFVIVAIGTSLGGPTGWALNPARDLGPRIAFAVLPIKDKPSADWAYSWVPIVGPMVGAAAAAGVAAAVL